MMSQLEQQPGVRNFVHRAERHVPRDAMILETEISFEDGTSLHGRLGDISASGLACIVKGSDPVPPPETRATRIRIAHDQGVRAWASGVLTRSEPIWIASEAIGTTLVAVAFDTPQAALVESLLDHLAPSPYVTDALL
ncbi:MAG: hypothetical protein FJZ01_19570 [Candidatus Sericytochromatia bacterium]|nr:hypothetical protein [Candidatus Tanganyikabacteria bacterium]